MRDLRGSFNRRQAGAVAGTLVIHIAMVAVLSLWRPRAFPKPPQQIPIELVELPRFVEVEAEIETIIPPVVVEEDLVEDIEEDIENDEPPEEVPPEPAVTETVPRTPQIETALQQRAPTFEEAEREEATAPQSSGLVLQSPETETPEVRPGVGLAPVPDIQEVDPQYVYTPDPFAETAPTLFARVSIAMNCSRINRDARPAFCPNYDEDDVYLAAIGAQRPSAWEQAQYDPVQDIANAQTALQRFQQRQSKHRPNASAVVPGVDFHPVTIPDADCVATPYGFGGPAGPNDSFTPGVPDSKALHCK